MMFFRLLTVTLCATVFCACASTLPPKNSELMTGEETAKAAADSAREAKKNQTTGILEDSSSDYSEKKVQPESQPAVTVDKVPGKKLYLFHCASCHGEDGKAARTDLNAGTFDEIVKVTNYGRQQLGMPAWKDVLTKGEITAIVQYVYALRDKIEVPK